jgi:CheY-like chemotaxis protein
MVVLNANERAANAFQLDARANRLICSVCATKFTAVAFALGAADEAEEFMDAAYPALSGKAIMVVEDEYLIALNIEMAIVDLGASVMGPFSRVDDALAALQGGANLPDAAILDINVGGRRVFPVAARLQERHIPFVFATGYDNWSIPSHLAHIQRFEKPSDPARLVHAVADQLARRDESGAA